MQTKKTILVVEDSEMNRALLCNILAPEYAVLEAENGAAALAILREQAEKVSLILLDIIMPVMDGYAFLAAAKADPALASIPVIVTTQNDSESEELNALAHGATDFVAKPYKPQIILHRVASIISLRETAALINLVQYDRLTGLYSKEFFYQKVNEILRRQPDRDYDIICSDVDNFKLINDALGMPTGDRILRAIAGLYTKFVGDRGVCGRFGADQFVCLLEHGAEYTDAMFRQANAKINEMPDAKNLTMKWGVYPVRNRTLSAEQMCDRALLAARSIKGQYGKFFACYDDALRSKLLREQAITSGMESALQAGQFEVYLQPKYSLRDDSLAGAEALVRWNHPEWGLMPPGEFIPLFERNGFISRLDRYVWDKTCAMLEEWDARGLPPICISVNVSRADIYHADLEKALLEIVRKHGLQPSRLYLEITESAYTEDPKQIIEVVGKLRQRGFVIEMDDFGSGYSSLNMLNEMPIDVLKLDMKFIQSETAKPLNQGILQFIISLARWMSLRVVAEGVETKEQLERLRAIGCDYVQGYYFARPMQKEAFEKLLRQAGEKKWQLVERAPQQRPQILLVADEDAGYRAQVRKTFADRFDIREAGNGKAAIDAARQYGNAIAGMILSLTLSDPDGITVLRTLQSEHSTWSIPIIATGPADEYLEARAMGLGADDFASKPHLQTTLQRRLLRIMRAHVLKRRERILQEEAYHDYLTGLLNQRAFQAAAEELSYDDCPLAVYLFDLDGLKRYNDDFGHAEGDHYLIQFAAILRAHTRDSDILARLGGDEFAVIMKQMRREESALQRAEAICAAVRQNDIASQNRGSCSCGIVLWDMDIPFSQALSLAGQALSLAKTKGKGVCRLWREKENA